jgi:hypothetical protein
MVNDAGCLRMTHRSTVLVGSRNSDAQDATKIPLMRRPLAFPVSSSWWHDQVPPTRRMLRACWWISEEFKRKSPGAESNARNGWLRDAVKPVRGRGQDTKRPTLERLRIARIFFSAASMMPILTPAGGVGDNTSSSCRSKSR